MLNFSLAFGLSDIHPSEVVLIGVIAVLVFGPALMKDSARELRVAFDQFWNNFR